MIAVPNEPEHAQWKLEGQSVTVEVDILSTIRAVKEKLSVRPASRSVAMTVWFIRLTRVLFVSVVVCC